ncbi:MAG: RsmE family RNA methyltransferase [Peptoniphilus sp.]|nr:RsmE family RNA methyltransferase [Peptoniphilus sp.]MDY3118873.1 RsmE family RNA methyltransferase [Peptoniphilus sp.]
MRHFFVKEEPRLGERAKLEREDCDHLLRVLRAREGEGIQIAFDDRLFRGELEIIEGEAFVLVAEEVKEKGNTRRLVLCQGVGKNQKTETVLKHATECGIDGMIPLQMDRSVSNLSKKYAGKKARFEKIAEEAAKQSNRRHVPVIGDLLAVESLIQKVGEKDRLIVCYEGEAAVEIEDADLAFAETVYVVIGPEGGFSKEEVALLEKANATFVTMGENILRTETAGVVASFVLKRKIERGK